MFNMKYDVAIISVTKDKIDPECLSSIKQLLERTQLKVKFVLVDNNSKIFDPYALARTHLPEAAVILRDKNYGFGRSCNLGAAEVEADYYFFLNPDTVVSDPLIIDHLYEFMTACPTCGIVAPQVRYPDGRFQETCRRFPKWYSPLIQRTSFLPERISAGHRRKFLMEDYQHKKYRMIDWAQGSALMIDGKLFHELGGFDKRFFMYYEDVDLCLRCWQKKRPVYYLPDVYLVHAYGKGSAVVGGLWKGLIKNSMARAHIVSWLKYSLKWMGKKI
jgi:GT2 family glycosyltransferase